MLFVTMLYIQEATWSFCCLAGPCEGAGRVSSVHVLMLWKIVLHALVPAVGTRSCPVLKQDMTVSLEEDISTRFAVASKFLA